MLIPIMAAARLVSFSRKTFFSLLSFRHVHQAFSNFSNVFQHITVKMAVTVTRISRV